MFGFFRKKASSESTPPPLPPPASASSDQASGVALIRSIFLPMAIRSPSSGLAPFFRALKKQKVIVIASWDSPESTKISLQDFHRGEELFIPMFLDKEEFKQELAGTPYENGGKAIDFDFLMGLVPPETLFVLSPGSAEPFDIRPRDYFSAL